MIEIPDNELEFSFARSGGPGGQNVNKVNTKAVLRWSVAASPRITEDVRARFMAKYSTKITAEGELLISSQKYRDQLRNIGDCRDKLRSMLAAVLTPRKKRRPTKPSAAAVEKRKTNKKQTSMKKQARRSPDFD